MADIHQLFPERQRGGVDLGGEPPDDGDMEKRIEKLERIAEDTAKELATIKQDVAVIKAEASHFATREDVSNAKNSIIMWVVSAILFAQLLPPLMKHFGLQ